MLYSWQRPDNRKQQQVTEPHKQGCKQHECIWGGQEMSLLMPLGMARWRSSWSWAQKGAKLQVPECYNFRDEGCVEDVHLNPSCFSVQCKLYKSFSSSITLVKQTLLTKAFETVCLMRVLYKDHKMNNFIHKAVASKVGAQETQLATIKQQKQTWMGYVHAQRVDTTYVTYMLMKEWTQHMPKIKKVC